MSRMWRSKVASRTPTQSVPKFTSLVIDDLSDDGRGVSRLQNKVIFVSDALPGEEVKVEVVKTTGKFLEGRTQKVVTPSSDRATPFCPSYSKCGGCQLQHLDYDAQIDFKRDRLKNLLTRQGVTSPQIEEVTSSSTTYRRRARIGIQYGAKGAIIGFRGYRSKRVVDIPQCDLLSAPLARVFALLRPILQQQRVISHVDLYGLDNECVGVHVRAVKQINAATLERLECLENIQLKLSYDDGLSIDTPWSLMHSGVSVDIGHHDFIQANGQVNQAMIDLSVRWLRERNEQNILELFSGLGNFSFALAKEFSNILSVEGSEEMTARAAETAEREGIQNISFQTMNLFDKNLQLPMEADAALIDPPRDGAYEVVKKFVEAKFLRTIIYVSCDPATFARDAQILEAGGYQLARLSLLDMFPQTLHSESVAMFIKK